MKIENDINKRKALKSGIWNTITSILLRAVSILTAPIFTRLLTTSDYGHVSNFTSWHNILYIFTGLCLYYSVGNAKTDFKNECNGYLASIQVLASISGLICFILAVTFQDKCSKLLEMDRNLIVLLFSYLIFYSSIEIMQMKFRFDYKYIQGILISVYNTVFVTGMSLILILCMNFPRYKSRIYGICLPPFLLAIVFWFSIIVKGRKQFSFKYWKYALKISIPLIPHALSVILLGQIDRIMIVKMVGTSEAGIYSFGYSYAAIAIIIVGAVSQSWQPLLYEYLHEKRLKEIKKTSNPINELVSACTLVFIVFAPEAIKILGEESYWNAKWVVAPVAIGTLYQYFYGNFSAVEFYTKKTIWVAAGSIIAAATNYILNLLLIPVFGYNVAAITTMVGYFILMLFHVLLSIKTYGCFVYDKKNICFCVINTTLIGFCIMSLYDKYFLRYIVAIIAIGVIGYRNKKIIISLLNEKIEKINRAA